MKFLAYNIKYDTNGQCVEGLPQTMKFEAESLEEAGERGADVVSDATGWCVDSLNVREINDKTKEAL